jgi:hypothetical protein
MGKLGEFLGVIAMIILITILMALPTQLLWNGCLVRAIDGLNPIGLWQTFGINVLCHILFKNSTKSKD